MKGSDNRGRSNRSHSWGAGLVAVAVLAAAGLTGCQTNVGGQTLPSPYYLDDDVQYHPPGPEFLLSREAAAMKQYADEQALVP